MTVKNFFETNTGLNCEIYICKSKKHKYKWFKNKELIPNDLKDKIILSWEIDKHNTMYIDLKK